MRGNDQKNAVAFSGGRRPSQRSASCPDRFDQLSQEGAWSSSIVDNQDLRHTSYDVRDGPNLTESIVYFDGSCPLCRAEIGYYRGKDRAGALRFIDVSETDAVTPEGTDRQQAMERFHVRASDGRLLSGAAAFVEVWACLPNWRWAARLASLPGALPVLELGYRIFLPARPLVSRLFGRVTLSKTVGDGVTRPPERRL